MVGKGFKKIEGLTEQVDNFTERVEALEEQMSELVNTEKKWRKVVAVERGKGSRAGRWLQRLVCLRVHTSTKCVYWSM